MSHAPWTSTSNIALRVTFRSADREPRVATSLPWSMRSIISEGWAYQTVATPCFRDVRTARRLESIGLMRQISVTYFRDCRTSWAEAVRVSGSLLVDE